MLETLSVSRPQCLIMSHYQLTNLISGAHSALHSKGLLRLRDWRMWPTFDISLVLAFSRSSITCCHGLHCFKETSSIRGGVGIALCLSPPTLDSSRAAEDNTWWHEKHHWHRKKGGDKATPLVCPVADECCNEEHRIAHRDKWLPNEWENWKVKKYNQIGLV